MKLGDTVYFKNRFNRSGYGYAKKSYAASEPKHEAVKASVAKFKAAKLGGFQTPKMEKPALGKLFKDGNNIMVCNSYTHKFCLIGQDLMKAKSTKLFVLKAI